MYQTANNENYRRAIHFIAKRLDLKDETLWEKIGVPAASEAVNEFASVHLNLPDANLRREEVMICIR
jgi:hypothetical protein